MQQIDDGWPAFPALVSEYVNHPVHGYIHRAQLGEDVSSGMSLRDYFAAQALAGILADPEKTKQAEALEKRLAPTSDEFFPNANAYLAYAYADAMLRARSIR